MGIAKKQRTVDPIFAALERHRAAHEACDEGRLHYQALVDAHEAQRDPRGVYLFDAPAKVRERVIMPRTGPVEAVYEEASSLSDAGRRGAPTDWRHGTA